MTSSAKEDERFAVSTAPIPTITQTTILSTPTRQDCENARSSAREIPSHPGTPPPAMLAGRPFLCSVGKLPRRGRTAERSNRISEIPSAPRPSQWRGTIRVLVTRTAVLVHGQTSMHLEPFSGSVLSRTTAATRPAPPVKPQLPSQEARERGLVSGGRAQTLRRRRPCHSGGINRPPAAACPAPRSSFPRCSVRRLS